MRQIIVFAALAACGTSSSAVSELREEQSSIDRVHFATETSIPQNAPPAVDVTVTGDAAREIYALTLALPVLAPGAYNCPADFGITYSLTFFEGDDAIVSGTVQPGGCEIATLSSEIASASLSPSAMYWSTLATDLGIAEMSIYPYAP